jgi:hypothetical protein
MSHPWNKRPILRQKPEHDVFSLLQGMCPKHSACVTLQYEAMRTFNPHRTALGNIDIHIVEVLPAYIRTQLTPELLRGQLGRPHDPKQTR